MKTQKGLSCCPNCGHKPNFLEQYRLKYNKENDTWDRIPVFYFGCGDYHCDYCEYYNKHSIQQNNYDDAKNEWNKIASKYNKENKKTLF
jgi:hypothetical protein